MNSNRPVPHLFINSVKLPDFIKMHNVFEIPTHKNINPINCRQSYVRHIAFKLVSQNLMPLIRRHQIKHFSINLKNFSPIVDKLFILVTHSLRSTLNLNTHQFGYNTMKMPKTNVFHQAIRPDRKVFIEASADN